MRPIELVETDFNLNTKTLKKNGIKDLNILFVYANWCGHCTRFKKTYIETASAVGSVINFYKIDSDKSPNLLRSLNVKAFPTLFIINKNGKVVREFTGDRSSTEKFIGEICKMTINCPRK